MYFNDKFCYKEWLDLDVSKEGFFETKLWELAKKFKILLSEIYRVWNSKDKKKGFEVW